MKYIITVIFILGLVGCRKEYVEKKNDQTVTSGGGISEGAWIICGCPTDNMAVSIVGDSVYPISSITPTFIQRHK